MVSNVKLSGGAAEKFVFSRTELKKKAKDFVSLARSPVSRGKFRVMGQGEEEEELLRGNSILTLGACPVREARDTHLAKWEAGEAGVMHGSCGKLTPWMIASIDNF